MTDSVETTDALQVQIDEAKAARNDELAQSLYARQQGTEDAYGLEPAPSASLPADADGEETGISGDVSKELTVATGADDETVTVSGGMDFAGNPEAVAHALEQMSWWDRDENGEVTGDRVAKMKAEWGSDIGTNLAHYQAFALAHPDIYEVLDAAGFGDHPAIVEVGAILGRRYATVAGDPGQMMTKKGQTQMADSMATKDIQARIYALEGVIEKAKARGEYVRANDAYLEQLRLDRLLPGGTDPVVGSSGGPTA